MKASIIDGKAISTQIKAEAAQETEQLKEQGIMPCLAVVLVGENSASKVYVNNKKKACEAVGVQSVSYEEPADMAEADLLALIEKLNNDRDCFSVWALSVRERSSKQQLLLALKSHTI